MKINWLIISLIALLSYSFMSFLIISMTRKGFPTSFILLGLSVVLVIFYAYQTFVVANYKPVFSISTLLILLIIGLLSSIGNLLAYQAANDAPNAGLALGITGMQSVVVTILAFIILKDKLTILQALGIILGLISIFLISAGGNQNKSETRILKPVATSVINSK